MRTLFLKYSAICFLLCLTLQTFAQKNEKALLIELITCHDSLKSSIYCNLANIYLDSSGNESLQYSEKALSFAKQFNNIDDLANANVILGSVYQTKGDYAKALTAFNTAVELLKNSVDYVLLQIANNNIGVIYQYTQQYELSLKSYLIGLDYAYKSNDSKLIAQSLTNIGNLYAIQEIFSISLQYYNKALSACQNKEELSAQIAGIYNNIGYIHFQQNDLLSARAAFNSSIHFLEISQDTYAKAVTLNNLAEIEILENNFMEAELLIKQAESIHIKMSYVETRKNLYLNTYQLYFKQKKFENAIVYLEKYHALKDSLYTLELNQQLSEVKTEYDVDKLNSESQLKDERIARQRKTTKYLIAVIISITALIMLLFRQIIAKRKINKLLNQKDELITLNINYARQIQLSCMNNIQYTETLKYFVFDQPKFGVGGDFYIIRKSINKTFIALGDCTGHGISGGFLSVLGIEKINYAIDKYNTITEVLKYLNYNFFSYITKSNSLRGESMSLSLISIEKHKINFTGSKQKIWKYEQCTDQLIEFQTGKSIIGNNPETNFTENSFDVTEGDIIFLSSDGFPDQYGKNNNGKFKYEAFRNLLKGCAKQEFNESATYIQQALLEWKGETEQTDDILVIGIKI